MTTEPARILIEFVPAAGKSVEAVLAKMERAVRDDVEAMQTTPADDEPDEPAQQREPCPECSVGHLSAYTSKRRGAVVVQYFECWNCHYKPVDDKRTVPADAVPRRRTRNKPAL